MRQLSSKIATCTVLAMISAACVAPPEEKPLMHKEEAKPVKMPVKLKKLGKVSYISMDEFFRLQQAGDVLIYDVRLPFFFQRDHIPGAINWPHTAYKSQIQKRDVQIQKALNSGQKVVFYCFSLMCPEARNVAKKLSRRDYDVHVFSSGIDSWRAAGLPLD